MRVFCKANTGAALSTIYKNKGYDENTQFSLVIGKAYIVYSMTLWASRVWYLIVEENKRFPEWLPEELFTISDTKLSKYWHYNKNQMSSKNQIEAVWGYKELVNPSDHYDKLVDQNENALAIFIRYQELMDLESPDSANSLIAKALEHETWLLCPICNEAWEAEANDPMVKCPNCKSTIHNPLYRE